jgi:hypothetical protein
MTCPPVQIQKPVRRARGPHQPTMRFQLAILSILATAAFFDSVAAVCCYGTSNTMPCDIALAYKMMSKDVTPEICCCTATSGAACATQCVSNISFISFRVS